MITVKELGKYFGQIKAVDGISFKVDTGDVLGFLGPNGAGKSTTMKMVTAFLEPSFGSVFVKELNVQESPREIKRLIGYLPENAPLYDEMSVYAFLSFITEVREIEKSKKKAAIDRVFELVSLSTVANQRIETLSRGYRRRVGIAQALIHDPAVLILDEPTEGLDPNQKHEVRELITKMSKEKCIILSTHVLEEVTAICNRTVIIANGKIVADSTPQELLSQAKNGGGLDEVFRKLTMQ